MLVVQVGHFIMLILPCFWKTVYPANSSDRIANYARLRQDILSRDAVVHRMSAEMVSPSGEFNVTYLLLLVDVMDIDQVKQLMTVSVYLQVKWTQDYLSWDPGQYGNVSTIEIEKDKIWTPRILLLQGYEDQLFVGFADWAAVDHSGQVQCYTMTYVTFRCAIDFRKYPFDTQQCRLGIMAHTSRELVDTEINYFIDDFKLATKPYVTAGEWTLVNFSHRVIEDANNKTYPVYLFTVRRRPAYYVITIIFPLTLTSTMTSLVFLVPMKTGEKISFFVTIYMSLTIYMNFISDVMPRNLSSAPYLVLLLVGVLTQGLLANLATLLVVNRYEKEKIKKYNSDVEHRIMTWSTQLAPGDGHDVKQQVSPSSPHTGVKIVEHHTKLLTLFLKSSQLDKIFFIFFIFLQGVLLGALFGATDWLSDTEPL